MEENNLPGVGNIEARLSYLQMHWNIRRTSLQRFADAQDRPTFVVIAVIQRRPTTQRVGVIALEYLNWFDVVYVFGG